MLEREGESILVFSLAWRCLFVPVICPVYSNVLPFTIYIYILLIKKTKSWTDTKLCPTPSPPIMLVFSC